MLERLQDEDALPTQLYLSTNAADYESFMRINRPRYKDSWQRWHRSLCLLSEMNTRTVLRITLIRGYNDSDEIIPAFASILEKGNPHFVEVKSYMHIGRSRNRLERSHMLDMDEVRYFASNLAEKSRMFSVMDESFVSRIVVLQNTKRFVSRWIPTYLQTN